VSIYEGVEKLLHPTPVKDVYINYIVLGVVFAFEAGAWLIAFREFTRAKAVIKSIRGLIEIHAGGATINEFLTMQLGPDDVLVTISLDFTESLSDNDVERRVSEMETAIKTAHPEVKRVFIEAQSFAAHMRQLQAATPDTEQQP